MIGKDRDPAQHKTSVEIPDDFDIFWEEVLGQASEIPLNPTLTHLPLRSTSEVDVYEIHYDSLDQVRIAGWYSRPKESVLPPPYPGLIIAPGYIGEPRFPKTWAKMGYATISVAPRGKLRSNSQFNPGYPGLLVHNIVDRHTYSYRGFYTDVCRAVDFLEMLPEVDSDRIGIHGSSQGGGLTIATAALRSDKIKCGAAGCPYLCGIMDAASLTRSYPYREITDYLLEYPDHESLVRETVSYFDGVNLATRIRCPILIYIGLGDDVCPPETGFDVHNALAGEKELLTYEGSGHDAGRAWASSRIEQFLAEHLAPNSIPQS
jgi:cephalosporin-C deacetylase